VSTGDVAVQLVDLSRSFGGVAAIRGVNLSIRDGEFFSLIGPSGCGKTTTLRLIAGLERPSDGRVLVAGDDVTNRPPYRRPVNTVFQAYALFPHLSVWDNVAFGLQERRARRAEIQERVTDMLALVELTGREKARPRQLSGGQQQRVALARALVLEPTVLLLDEPLGALDLKLRRQMQTLLKGIQRERQLTFVYVTHDQEEAFAMSDRVGVMNGGVLEQVGDPLSVYREPATAFVADFVGASNRIKGRITGVTPAGAYDLEMQDGRALTGSRGVPGMQVGAEALVVLRPEAARLGGAEPGSFTVPGEVTDVSFLGPQIVYRVRTELGELTVMDTGDVPADAPRVGNGVTVAWRSSAAWAVPAAEPAQYASQPPSTGSAAPLTKLHSSEAR
jgi:spermidine/putrescine transport system ATP-binding protein